MSCHEGGERIAQVDSERRAAAKREEMALGGQTLLSKTDARQVASQIGQRVTSQTVTQTVTR